MSKKMSFEQYQEKARRTQNPKNDLTKTLLQSGIGLVSESGEFINALKKVVFQGHSLNQKKHCALVDELGDIMWYLALACDALSIDMSEIGERNIDKLEKRYPEKFTVKNSVNRD